MITLKNLHIPQLFQTGNVWTLINPSASQSVRELDRTLTDDVLLREMARSEGFEYDSLRQPKDVILTRNKLMLILNDGSRHSFDIESAPFLRDINPNEPILNFCGKGSKIQINMK